MSSWLYLLFIFVIFGVKILTVSCESQICGYNGDSLVCCSGFKKDEQGECTIPICENDCGQGGRCIRPDTCYCSNGRVGPSCPDDNRSDEEGFARRKEIQESCIDNCNGQGECINGKCECRLGYSGHSCLEKLLGTCYLTLSRGICQKSENNIKIDIEVCCGAFDAAWGDPCKKCPRTRCGQGFMEIDGQCRDVDECTYIQGLCKNGRCENLHGSYRCVCTAGYRFEHNKGDCVKVEDACKQLPSVCGPRMKCVSFPMGKYSCPCIAGFVKSDDQKSCVPTTTFNFCNVYGSYVCQYGTCMPDGNNYKCHCNPGYVVSGDLKSCKKSIDYCSLYQNALCTNGICVSINDDFFCKCNKGYNPSFNRKKCTSVCELHPGTLCPNAKCVPQPGGDYECQCNEGYSAIGKGKQCRQIMSDQSASISNLASNNDNQASYDVDYCSYNYYRKQCEGGRCYNRKGHYRCECLHGYVSDKNGLACKKIDYPGAGQMLDMAANVELKSYCDKYGSFVCNNGHCVESGSSYQCRCNSGYRESSDGKSCYDINECADISNVCAQGTCTNSPGSYQCSCYDGYTIHFVAGGPKCYDRNECVEDVGLCTNGQCVNKWGTFTCNCNSGYTLSKDEKQCVSVQVSSDSNIIDNDDQCKNCISSCFKKNSTHSQCHCPSGLDQVLNTGLCAPMSEVVDIQFDIPVRRRRRSVKSSTKSVFFELQDGINKKLFASHVLAMYKDIVIHDCKLFATADKNGILCSYRQTSN